MLPTLECFSLSPEESAWKSGKSDSRPSDPVTNLYFCKLQSLKSEVLFVTTLHVVVCLSLPNGPFENPTIIYRDAGGGCSPRCAALSPSLESLFVLREGGLFLFHSEQGNLSALPCDGNVSSDAICEAFRYYSVTVTQVMVLHDLAVCVQDPKQQSPVSLSPSSSIKQTLNIALNFPALRLLAFSSRLVGVTHVITYGV